MNSAPSPVHLNQAVLLPNGLTLAAIQHAVDYIEREASEFVELYDEQRNAFSTVVGIYGAKALHTFSNYEQNPNRFHAQQRFPDLIRRGVPLSKLRAQDCLESKASIRAWELQAHYNHAGWYIVWRYLVDPTRSLTGRPVVVWRVHVAFLSETNWKYEPSSAGAHGGGRTHTFGVKKPATVFADKAAYDRLDVTLRGGKPVLP